MNGTPKKALSTRILKKCLTFLTKQNFFHNPLLCARNLMISKFLKVKFDHEDLIFSFQKQKPQEAPGAELSFYQICIKNGL